MYLDAVSCWGRINLILLLVLSLIVTPLIFIYSDHAAFTGCYGDFHVSLRVRRLSGRLFRLG